MKIVTASFILLSSVLLGKSCAFVTPRVPQSSRCSVVRRQAETTDSKREGETEEVPQSTADKFLKAKFPDFYYLLIEPSKEVQKAIRSGQQCTVFAPGANVFQSLTEKRQTQIKDPRNLETIEKMAAYHVIPEEMLSWDRLFQEDWTVPKVDGKPQLSIGGVKTLGGDVNIGRSMSGGIFGSPFGAKEDGGVTVGPSAKIVQSFKVGDNCVVHEVDAFVSPEILWRYADQLRIPGF